MYEMCAAEILLFNDTQHFCAFFNSTDLDIIEWFDDQETWDMSGAIFERPL